MTSGELEHVARLERIYRQRAGTRWLVICSRCGQVGTEHDRKADARAVADRHEAIQGFERRRRDNDPEVM